MTPFQHYLLGSIICILLWSLWLKNYFYDEDEYKKAAEFIRKIFFD